MIFLQNYSFSILLLVAFVFVSFIAQRALTGWRESIDINEKIMEINKKLITIIENSQIPIDGDSNQKPMYKPS